jgi:hypothetical protein
MMLIITSEFFVNLVIKNTMKNTQHIINVFKVIARGITHNL